MKKVLLSALFIATTSTALFAQVSVGPKLGLGISKLTDTKSTGDKTDYKSVITPVVGAVVNFQMGDLFALRPELLYTQRGAKVEESGTGYSFKSTMRVNYLELPINAVLGGKVGPGRLEGFAGPAFAFGLGGKAKTEFTAGGNTETTNTTIKAKKDPNEAGDENIYVNPLNVSLNFGIDYKFDNGLLIQAGYNLGLTNTNAHNSDSDAESARKDDVTKASSINFAVGFLFGGK